MAPALAAQIPGGSKNSHRPSMDLKIENFTDDYVVAAWCCGDTTVAQGARSTVN
jgi:hypothetical protein